LRKSSKLVYDPLTEQIRHLLIRIPKVGNQASRLYLWRAMMFNFMLVGSTGLIVSWFLYELVIRVVFVDMWQLWGGSFLGMTVTTTLVFLWNYELNKRWSLNTTAQIMRMKKEELKTLRETIDRLLEKKFDVNGSRI
jgi:magnesium-transporting ATPase (P-type)